MEVSIRRATPADADAIAAVHVASWEGSYRGILPDEEFKKRPLDVRRRQWREWLETSGIIVLAACDCDGSLAGFAAARLLLVSESPFDSYLATLYLLPEVKGRGAGTKLLSAMASELLQAGARSMVLRTLRLNPARAFYEKLGARFLPEGADVDAGHFDDVVYAFDDLETLVR